MVNVKPGFARNYLLPQKKALRATDANRTLFETQRVQLETTNLEQRSEAEAVALKLDGLSVVIVRQASDNDQLYGSVTVRDAAQAITEAGFTLDSKQVQMARPIKKVGLHQVTARLHPEVNVMVTVNVARSEDEAALQAQGKRVTAEGDLVDDDDSAEAAAEAHFAPAPADASPDQEDGGPETETETDPETA